MLRIIENVMMLLEILFAKQQFFLKLLKQAHKATITSESHRSDLQKLSYGRGIQKRVWKLRPAGVEQP